MSPRSRSIDSASTSLRNRQQNTRSLSSGPLHRVPHQVASGMVQHSSGMVQHSSGMVQHSSGMVQNSAEGGYTMTSGPITTSSMSERYVSSHQHGGAAIHQLAGSSHLQHSTAMSGQYVTGGRYVASGGATQVQITGHEYQGSTRHVTGQERVISVTERVDESRSHVIGERTVEHTVTVPKRIVHEDVIEKYIIVPETVRREEIIEEVQIVQEKIIEVARPIIQEKIVEVPEYVYVDKVVEVPEVIVQEKIREVAKIEYQERVREVPKIITQEKIVEVPEIEYHEYLVEKVIEVPEIREQVITKEIPVPQYIDTPYPEYVDVEAPYEVQRNIPIPVEAISTFEYKLPNFKSRVNKIQYPIYVPRFIEVPVAEELFSGALIQELNQNCSQVGLLAGMTQAVSLCEVENLATMVRSVDIERSMATANLHEALKEAWTHGSVSISHSQLATTSSHAMAGYQRSTRGESTHPSFNRRHSKSRKVSRRHSGRV